MFIVLNIKPFHKFQFMYVKLMNKGSVLFNIKCSCVQYYRKACSHDGSYGDSLFRRNVKCNRVDIKTKHK